MPACPRCSVALVQRTATPANAARPITADLCERCGGLWFDGAELEHASPALGGLPLRLGEIAEIAAASEIKCPRCQGAMALFDLLDVPIDLCRDCQGVWLDGGEYEALGKSDAPAGDGEAASGTKRRATPDRVACKVCARPTPLSMTYYTDQGLVCADCNVNEADAMKQRGEAFAANQAAYDRAYGPGSPYWRSTHPVESELEVMGKELGKLQREVRRLRNDR